MKGITIVKTRVLNRLIDRIDRMEELIKNLGVAGGRPWMSIKKVCEYMGKGSTWVDMNKWEIGFTKAGGEIRFKRKDVDAYLEGRYFRS